MRSLALVVVFFGCGVKPSLVGDGGPADAPTRASLAISPDPADLAPGGAVAMLTITNTGLDTTDAIGLELMGVDSPSFELVSSSCSVLTAGATCAVAIKLEPRRTGALTATLRASAGDVETTARLRSPGVSALNGLVIMPPTRPFAITAVKNDSPPLAFVVTNLGAQSTGQLKTTVDATNPQFTIVGAGNTCLDQPLAPQATCMIPVAFTPRGTGPVARGGLLTVTDQVAASATQILAAHTGQIALPSSTSLSPITGPACASPMGATTISFSNETWTATTMSLALNGNNASSFTLTTDCMPTLATGMTCRATVTPNATDAPAMTMLKTNLVVNATQAAAAFTMSLQVTANLGPCDLQITPLQLQFGQVAAGTHPPVTRSFTVANLSPTTSYLLATTLGGMDPADYMIVSDSCTNQMLLPASGGSPCSVTLAFTPTALGPRTATVAVTTANLAPPPVQLSGNGVVSPLSVMPESVTFIGPVGAGTISRSVTLSTTGAPGPLSFAITPPFTLPPSPICPALAPGISCTFSIGFTPNATGTVTGNLTITSAVGGAAVSLTGTGQ